MSWESAASSGLSCISLIHPMVAPNLPRVRATSPTPGVHEKRAVSDEGPGSSFVLHPMDAPGLCALRQTPRPHSGTEKERENPRGCNSIINISCFSSEYILDYRKCCLQAPLPEGQAYPLPRDKTPLPHPLAVCCCCSVLLLPFSPALAGFSHWLLFCLSLILKSPLVVSRFCF